MSRKLILLTLCCALQLLASAACSGTDGANSAGHSTAATSGPSRSPVASETTTSGANVADASTIAAPPTDVVRITVPAVELSAGESEEVSVQLDIADGYHVNSNPATGKYQIATELRVEAAGGDGDIRPGAPKYPAGITKKFAFADEPLAVYEGEATIKLPLSAASGAKSGARLLRARIRVQPCDDKVCYPPRTVDADLRVNVN